jgi:RND family efflux transporter MFP subunit
MNRNIEKQMGRAPRARSGFLTFHRLLPVCFELRVSHFELPARLLSFALLLAPARAEEVLGYTEPYRLITVAAGEAGVIGEVLVKEGDRVKQGQVLAKLDTAVLAAELEIASAEAKLAGTRRERVVELSHQTRVTPEESEKAATEVTIKQAQVRKIEAMIEARTMRSPVDGVVTEIKRDPSESVSVASPHVLTVVQIDKLTANLFLPPERTATLQVGDRLDLALLDAGTAVSATVDFVSPITDAASGTVRVKFTIDNADGKLRSGARCTLAPTGTAAR